MPTHFSDQSANIRALHGSKWTVFPEDVLPLWVADMDFNSPPPVIEALTERVQSGMFGYTLDYPPLRHAVVARMKALYDWHIQPEDVLLVPGMVVALNMVTRAIGKAGDGVLMQTPVYGPFLNIPANNGRFAQMVDLVQQDTSEHTFTYHQDLTAFANAITKQSSLFYLCNPHNPGGMVYTREELQGLADICLQNNVTIVSDEIHSDLILDGKHIPIASLSDTVAQHTITLIAPSKTYNLPGLATSIAIIQNPELRQKVAQQIQGMGLHVNALGLLGATVAYEQGDAWLAEVLGHLKANRDFASGFLGENLPQLRFTVPQATYLMWVDASAVPTPDNMPVAEYLLKNAKIALNGGDFFRKVNATSGRDSFVRLNFACSRETLTEALTRFANAINS